MSIDLTVVEKVAILLISLDKKYSADVLRHLSEKNIEKIAYCIAESKVVPQEAKSLVLKEFYQICVSEGYLEGNGGLLYAKEVLTEALGSERCVEIFGKMSAYSKVKPFDFLKNVDSNDIIGFLKSERNQTIALILSFMEPKQSAVILSSLEEERRADIIMRIAKMSKISPDIISRVENEVKMKINSFVSPLSSTDVVGINIAADIIASMERAYKDNVFEEVKEVNPDLAEELEKRMFLFEDIIKLDQRYAQIVLSKIPNDDLALALKYTSENMKNFVFDNISERAKDIIIQEMDMLGRIRLSEVLEAQQKIVTLVLEMEKNQEIVISKDDNDKFVG